MTANNLKEALRRIDEAKEQRLRFLDLRGLGLSTIPKEIGELYFLSDIDLSYNSLWTLPDEIYALDNVQYLNLSSNNLSELNFQIGKFYIYQEIDISNNLFNFIPKSILGINVGTIIYDNNPFLDNLPDELIEREDLAYIDYYLDALSEYDNVKRLFETKLLIVGKGDVGKTTLMKTLLDSNFKVSIGEEASTHGITINSKYETIILPAKKPFYRKSIDFENLIIKEDFAVGSDVQYYPVFEIYPPDIYDKELIEWRIADEPFKSIGRTFFFEKDIKLNIWDFGGQEILYSTHQFFLTKRSIYLFVWEPRSDTEEENFDYWLNVIKRLSFSSPVIVVMNKSDILTKSIDEDSYSQKFDNIKGFHSISCLNKEGVTSLIKKIKETIAKIPHLGDKLPKSWDEIRLKLKELNQDYIDFQKFTEICNLKDPENIHFISEYLTDLGDIIHFKEDFQLRDMVILNPHWVTKAVYELIHSKEIQKNQGQFFADDLPKLLDKKTYPMSTHLELVSLMEKFDICFKIIGSKNKYIIPTLLNVSHQDIDMFSVFKNSDSLKYEVQYSFLLHGLIERLICRLNNIIEKTNFWKYGAVFNTENNRALIVLNKNEKKINLYVVGDMRPQLFSVIIHALDGIHKDLKLGENDFDHMVACNCIECSTQANPYFFRKKTLLKFIEKNKRQILCHQSTEEVIIEELLIGYKSNKSQRSLIGSFVQAMSALQTRHKLLETYDEDQINTFFQVLLSPLLSKYGLITNEQAYKGKSESGNSQGRLDIGIETVNRNNVSIFEGFILNSFRKATVNTHLQKTIKNYDPNGLKEKFVGIYCRAKDFVKLFEKFLAHFKATSFEDIEFTNIEDLSHIHVNASEMKVIRGKYKRSNTTLTLYIILVNLNL